MWSILMLAMSDLAILAKKKSLAAEEVIAYASHTLNQAERNYTTTEGMFGGHLGLREMATLPQT